MKFLFIILLFPLQLFAQSFPTENEDITGVWTGSLYNDTTKQFIHYELAISEFNKRLNGYSHTTFIIDSIKNIGVKEVKIKNKKGLITVEDEKLIDNNYTAPPAKGVRTFMELTLSENDSTYVLSGPWHTNRTREYNSLTGTVFLEKKKKINETAIVPKLEQMGLSGKLSFLIASVNHEESIVANNTILKESANKNPVSTEIAALNKKETPAIIPDTTITNPEIVILKTASAISDKKTIPQQENIALKNVPDNSSKEVPGEKPELPAGNKNLITKRELAHKGEVKLNTSTREIQKRPNIIAEENEKKAVKEVVREEALLSEKNINSANQTVAVNKEKVKPGIPVKESQKAPNAVAEDNQKKTTTRKEIIRSKTPAKEIQKDQNILAKENQNKFSEKTTTEGSGLTDKNMSAIDKKAMVKKQATSDTSDKKVLEKQVSLIEQKQLTPELVNKKGNVLISTPLKKILPLAAAEISKREIETIRTVEIMQDSLVFSLYDNGAVDGDTVSVLLNGVVIMPRVGLLEKAFNKTIYLTPEMGDSINIIMYAENLGSIAPNTGLLVVRDGDTDYEIRFSGDLKKNSAIILKRKKK